MGKLGREEMMKNFGMIRTGATALVAIAALPAVASAQQQQRETFELPAIQVEAFQNPLHVAALELYETPARWEEAGELHEQAAKELVKNDAGQFFGYNRAAALYLYAGETARSRRAMEKAASVAEATGDDLTAANAWVDAAFIAIAEGFTAKKREFVANARTLVESETMSESDRASVLARIDGAPTTAIAARLAVSERLTSPDRLVVAD